MARAILAEGSSGALQIRTAPQWERFEARDPCRGFIGHSTNTQNVENDRGLTKSRMNTPHTANIDAGSHASICNAMQLQCNEMQCSVGQDKLETNTCILAIRCGSLCAFVRVVASAQQKRLLLCGCVPPAVEKMRNMLSSSGDCPFTPFDKRRFEFLGGDAFQYLKKWSLGLGLGAGGPGSQSMRCIGSLRKAEGKTFDVLYAGCSMDPSSDQLKLLPLVRSCGVCGRALHLVQAKDFGLSFFFPPFFSSFFSGCLSRLFS